VVSPAGYSGTPLAKKLGVKENAVILLVGAPKGWSVPELPNGARITRSPKTVGADVTIAFYSNAANLEKEVADVARGLGAKSLLWVAWPRRAGGHESDITDTFVRETLLPVGVVDVKVAALDADWSGLKFVWRLKKP
jgi:hypothetical protein